MNDDQDTFFDVLLDKGLQWLLYAVTGLGIIVALSQAARWW